MFWIALKMLFGDRAKYAGIVTGLTFASLLIVQQAGIFFGIMSLTYSTVSAVPQADIWVMDPEVRFIDDRRPMSDTALLRVRGVEGVAWATPFYKGGMRARLSNGRMENCSVVGVDDASLVGGPSPLQMIEGKVEDLRRAEAVIIDETAATDKLALKSRDPVKGEIPVPLKVGDTFELNDHRATVVGICKKVSQLQGEATVYTTYPRAIQFAPFERRLLTFVLVKAKPGLDHEMLARRIADQTNLAAYTSAGFKSKTFDFMLKNAGFAFNFSISVVMGFIIGTAIAGQTFYMFTLDNLKYFGVLKAMGASHRTLIRMILVQSLSVGAVGYGIGVGLASCFGQLSGKGNLVFKIPWYLFLGSMVAVALICVFSSLLSIRKVLRLDPAIVFKA
jgi:putative ABC transport system permease protein